MAKGKCGAVSGVDANGFSDGAVGVGGVLLLSAKSDKVDTTVEGFVNMRKA